MNDGVQKIDKVNAELVDMVALLPRGAAHELAEMTGLHYNTVCTLIKGRNAKVTDNVLDVREAVITYLERHKQNLMSEADRVHQTLRRNRNTKAYEPAEADA